MKAKTKFLKMYYKIPKPSRNLVWFMGPSLYSLNVIKIEVEHNTKLGNDMLKDMGFEDN